MEPMVASRFWHPSRVHFNSGTDTGGLRVATTSGYCLATFRVASSIKGKKVREKELGPVRPLEYPIKNTRMKARFRACLKSRKKVQETATIAISAPARPATKPHMEESESVGEWVSESGAVRSASNRRYRVWGCEFRVRYPRHQRTPSPPALSHPMGEGASRNRRNLRISRSSLPSLVSVQFQDFAVAPLLRGADGAAHRPPPWAIKLNQS